jgi:phosphorylated CTD-interacting factor 1
MPPLPASEARGLASMRRLSELFKSECASLGGRKLHSHFEKWLWLARGAAEECVPVIPNPPAPEASADLHRKLICTGMSEHAALAATKAIQDMAVTLAQRMALASDPPQAASHDVVVVVLGDDATSSETTVTLSCCSESVTCRRPHLEKLRALLRDDDDANGREKRFERRAYCVLARVLALQGGEPRAGGMQAAVGYRVFDALARHHGAAFELFASPLNARFRSFCSASPDVDRAFGSVGSFFSPSLDPLLTVGAFQANPPYDPPIVAAMARRMQVLLAAADGREGVGGALTFVVIIPYWPDKPCWQALERSTSCSVHLRLPQAEHGFLEGGQHYRPQLWRRANHDTSVFFLQSRSALRPSHASLEALRSAFNCPDWVLEPPNKAIAELNDKMLERHWLKVANAEKPQDGRRKGHGTGEKGSGKSKGEGVHANLGGTAESGGKRKRDEGNECEAVENASVKEPKDEETPTESAADVLEQRTDNAPKKKSNKTDATEAVGEAAPKKKKRKSVSLASGSTADEPPHEKRKKKKKKKKSAEAAAIEAVVEDTGAAKDAPTKKERKAVLPASESAVNEAPQKKKKKKLVKAGEM